MNRISVSIFLTVLLTVLPGCDTISTDINSLLRPPQLTAEQSEIHNALDSVIGSGRTLQLKYPKRGDYLSAFVMYDLDADGQDEALVFYEDANTEYGTRINILDNEGSGWHSVLDYPGNGSSVDQIRFVDVSGGEGCDILIGWEHTSQELRTVDLEEILYNEAVRYYEFREKAANEVMRQRREARGVAAGEDGMREIERIITLQVVDEYWMDLIDAMDDLKQGIYLRSYGQHDPVVEYKQQGYEMFEATITAIREETVRRMFLFRLAPNQEVQRKKVAKEVQAVGSGDSIVKKQPVRKSEKKVGPNDPCPCGSGRKYKKCCMQKDKNAGRQEQQ